jgi:N6-L-threonylcarbamoyladenine synthase
MEEAGASFGDVSWVAVSNKPGLLGSILIGVTVAKALAFSLDIPLIGINHIEAHPYANLLVEDEFTFPLVHLIVAGGHTLLIHQTAHFEWQVVGRSLDDAAGECADKVARMFGLPMPGGKEVDALALAHEPDSYKFPRPLMNDGTLDFSFSGLKTAMKHFRDKHGSSVDRGPVLAAFFASVSDVLIAKTLEAARRLSVNTITVSGGLAASRHLRQRFETAASEAGLQLLYPPPHFCTDNAAMVACLAAHYAEEKRFSDLSLRSIPNLSE